MERIQVPGFMSDTSRKPKETAYTRKELDRIKVLMIDDQAMVCEAVRRMLEGEEGIEFYSLTNPAQAIAKACEIKPTVILQDLVMPDIDGLTLVRFLRGRPELKDIPLIVLSSKEEPETKKKAFELGANDYMVKLPDRLEVIARIRYHSKGYINLLQRNAAEMALRKELDQAAAYVRSLFPEKLNARGIQTDWVFISSTDLAGDSFGYHWIDDDHFAVYLLDVCGHGVGAALLSVSAINVMRAETLRAVDFRDPSAVMEGLNEAFDMDKQNQMYFTMWYGVYRPSTRELQYCSAGHPPSILVRENGYEALSTPGMVVGGMPGLRFEKKSVEIRTKDRLYVFSDGVYEVNYADGSGMMTVEEFAKALQLPAEEGKSKVESMVSFVRRAQGQEAFEDDFSLVEIQFH